MKDRLPEIKRLAISLADRNLWIVDLLILALLATFVAAGLDAFLATRTTHLMDRLVQETGSSHPTPAPATASPAVFSAVTGEDILARNIFDSVTGPLTGIREVTETPPGEGEEPVPEQPAFTPRCTLPISLQACYASPDHPEYSFIAVQNGAQSEILELGDTILEHQVSYITWQYAFLYDTQGMPCYLDLWENEPGHQKDHGKKHPKTKQGKNTRAKLHALLKTFVKKVSAHHRVIDPKLAKFLAQNDELIVQDVRMLPHIKGGSPGGLKLYGIRKSSVLGHLGFRNGDVLVSMKGPKQVKHKFSSLGGSTSVQVKRKGKPLTLRFTVK